MTEFLVRFTEHEKKTGNSVGQSILVVRLGFVVSMNESKVYGGVAKNMGKKIK